MAALYDIYFDTLLYMKYLNIQKAEGIRYACASWNGEIRIARRRERDWEHFFLVSVVPLVIEISRGLSEGNYLSTFSKREISDEPMIGSCRPFLHFIFFIVFKKSLPTKLPVFLSLLPVDSSFIFHD